MCVFCCRLLSQLFLLLPFSVYRRCCEEDCVNKYIWDVRSITVIVWMCYDMTYEFGLNSNPLCIWQGNPYSVEVRLHSCKPLYVKNMFFLNFVNIGCFFFSISSLRTAIVANRFCAIESWLWIRIFLFYMLQMYRLVVQVYVKFNRSIIHSTASVTVQVWRRSIFLFTRNYSIQNHFKNIFGDEAQIS